MYCKLVKYMKPWPMLTFQLVDNSTGLKKGITYAEQQQKKLFSPGGKIGNSDMFYHQKNKKYTLMKGIFKTGNN